MIVADFMKQPAARFDWVFTARDNYRDEAAKRLQ